MKKGTGMREQEQGAEIPEKLRTRKACQAHEPKIIRKPLIPKAKNLSRICILFLPFAYIGIKRQLATALSVAHSQIPKQSPTLMWKEPRDEPQSSIR